MTGGRDSSKGPARDVAIMVAMTVVVVVVVGITAQSVGFTRDEGYYFKAAELYAAWFRQLASAPSSALSAAGINAHLGYNPEHPFLMKGLFALSRVLQQVLGIDVMGSNAMRFPAWLVAGGSVALVYALARAARLARSASMVAALLFVSMPRVFWHMHLSTFDIAVTAAHAGLIAAYLQWRTSLRGAVVIGLLFGVCAATKHNVLPIPALLVLHWLLTDVHEGRRGRLSIPVVFVTLAVLGPVVYVTLWPWLWPDVAGRFGAYVAFHLRHEHYPILLFGELLTKPPFPWSFPLVMWGLTVPLPQLVVGASGVVLATVTSARFLWRRLRGLPTTETTRVPLGDVARQPSGATAVLLLLNAAFPVVLIALPSSPIFGGTKHWMNALPFVCVLGAWALQEAVTAVVARGVVARRSVVAAVVVVVGIVAALPGGLQTGRVWPYGLSSYNAVAGFSRGAANLGLQRTFWGYEIRAALPAINAAAPRGARLHPGDVNADSHRRAVEDGLLRADITWSPFVRGADIAHVEPLGEFKQQQLDVDNDWHRRDPDIIIDVEGVPLSTVTFRR